MKTTCFLLFYTTCLMSYKSFSQSIGIGTAAPHPSAQLDVVSTSKGMLLPRMTLAQRNAIASPATGLLVYQTDNTPGFYYYNGASWIQFSTGSATNYWTLNGSHITNNNTGSVGIGINSPAFKLDVMGRMRIKAGTVGNVNTSAGIWMDDYRDGTTNRFFFGMKDSIRAGFYGGGSGGAGWDFTFNTQNGNIGIGYLDPANYKLTIDGEVGLYRTTQNGLVNYGTLLYETGSLLINSKLGNIFTNTSSEDVILQYATGLGNTSGNVGIGTNDPFYKLTLNGDAGIYDGTAFIGFLGKSGTDFLINAKQGNIIANTSPENIILQYATGTGNTAGKVGIGTNAPVGKLHVSGSGELFRTGNTTTAIQMTSDYIQFVNSGAGKFFMQLSGNDFTISPSSGNSTGLLVLNGNQVTIGQITPANGYKLSVGGKAICEELKVQLQGNWPDYVFNQNYKLRSIEELRAFIAQNKHLPNIPAAAELEKNGMEVGEMQRKMMEKIEELTLYILQLEEKLETVQKQISKK
jgi:hypothetical protein